MTGRLPETPWTRKSMPLEVLQGHVGKLQPDLTCHCGAVAVFKLRGWYLCGQCARAWKDLAAPSSGNSNRSNVRSLHKKDHRG